MRALTQLRSFRLWGPPVAVVVIAAIGEAGGGYFQQLLVNVTIYAIFALGLFLIMHLLGEVSFGHGLYLGLASYLFAIVSTKLIPEFWLSALIAVAGCGVFGFLTGLAGARLHRIPFAMLTFALGGILLLVAQNAIAISGGEVGLSLFAADGPDTPTLGIIGAVALILAMTAVGVFLRTTTGRTLVAIRDNEPLAETLGIKPWPFRLAILTAASVLGGVAGVLYGVNLGSIQPEVFNPYYSGIAILMVVVGGRRAPVGSLVGSVFFVAVPELLRTTSATLQIIIFAAVLILAVRFVPGGLAGLGAQLIGWIRRRRGAGEPA